VLQLLELVVQLTDLAAAGDRLVDHRAARHLAHVLAEVADGHALGQRDLAVVGLLSPTIRRNTVDLPAPFGPVRPTFSPG
jgi:hypothetical protein